MKEKHYLLRVHIQDGESTYYEYFHTTTEAKGRDIIAGYSKGFMMAVKGYHLQEITKTEYKTLDKLGVF